MRSKKRLKDSPPKTAKERERRRKRARLGKFHWWQLVYMAYILASSLVLIPLGFIASTTWALLGIGWEGAKWVEEGVQEIWNLKEAE